MAILNDIRALFAQCPALKDLEARTDKLETDAEGYSILPTGSTVIARDMDGAATWQWVQEQDRKGVPLTDAEFVSITAADGGISEWDENNTYGVYKIEGALIYEKE